MSTKIPWTDETWPVVTGCSHSGTPGCDNCYAARMAATRLKHHPRYEGLATISDGKARWTGKINFNYDVLEQPLRWRKPRRVFIASMGDLFHPSVPDAFIIEVFVRMGEAHHHIYQLLTKRPRRMFDFISKSTWGVTPLPNVHLGVSVENQAAADARIPWLLQTPAAVRYVSVEPTLGAVNITDQPWWDWRYTYDYYKMAYPTAGPPLDWVICGGESGPGARPMHPDWARSIRDQCQTAGVPFFFKQWGGWVPNENGCGGDYHFNSKHICLNLAGESFDGWVEAHGERIAIMAKASKKAAGHLLDGRTWQEFPEK